MKEPEKIHALLVEDNAADAEWVKRALAQGQAKHFELECVDRLSAGLERLQKGGIDLILSDLNLQDSQGGLDTFEKLHSQAPGLPIVLLTGNYEDESLALEALRKGAQDYLLKGQVDGKLLSRVLKYAVERKQGEELLQAANRKLKELSVLKDEFVAAISHEIRTPLTVAKEGVAQVLEEVTGPIQEEQKKVLTMARDNMDRLGRIINNLLDLAKLEAGKVSIKRRRVNLWEAATQVAADFKLQTRKKGLELTVGVPSEGLEVYADWDKLHQILVNLVGNALKFTQKGKIEISAREGSGMVECEVSDTGEGISESNLPKLFQKFEQVGRAPGPGEKGTGLGLVIVKDLVELHGGTVRVESALGVGSKFFFALPKYTAETRIQECVRDRIEEAAVKGQAVTLFLIALTTHEVSPDSVSLERMKALQAQLEGFLKRNLCRQGDEAILASDGVTVVLAACDKKGAFQVKARCEQLLKEYLANEKGVSMIQPRFAAATYPEDAQTHRELVRKAKETLDR